MRSAAGHNKLFGIFGDPIDHTLSPVMHNAAFEALGLPYFYFPFHVSSERLKGAVGALLPLGIKGVNITIPHKEAVIPLLDSVAEDAEKVGAVNTIEVTSTNRLVGHNTDGKGFIASLHEMDVDPSGKRVVLLGAGGAAGGVAFQLAKEPVSELILMARSPARGKRLAERLASAFPALKIALYEMNWSKGVPFRRDPSMLLINSTPLGMREDDPSPFPMDQIDPTWVVADLIYRPYRTPLLISAQRAGAKPISGLGMLLHQGALAFEIWTKQKPSLSVMKKALLDALHLT